MSFATSALMPSVPEERSHGRAFARPDREQKFSRRSGAKGRGPWDGPGEGPLPVTRIANHSEADHDMPEMRKKESAQAARRNAFVPSLRTALDFSLLGESAVVTRSVLSALGSLLAVSLFGAAVMLGAVLLSAPQWP